MTERHLAFVGYLVRRTAVGKHSELLFEADFADYCLASPGIEFLFAFVNFHPLLSQGRIQRGGRRGMPPIVDWVDFFYRKKAALLGLFSLPEVLRGPQICQNALAPRFSRLRRSDSVAPNVKSWLRPCLYPRILWIFFIFSPPISPTNMLETGSSVAWICCEEGQRWKLCHGALTVDFGAGCSSCSMTNSFLTDTVLIEIAVSCWHLHHLTSQTTQYLDSWLSDLEVEGEGTCTCPSAP